MPDPRFEDRRLDPAYVGREYDTGWLVGSLVALLLLAGILVYSYSPYDPTPAYGPAETTGMALPRTPAAPVYR
jgi:hypothetical protein